MPTTAHRYGAGTRLSSAYTFGRDGKPFPRHMGGKSSKAYAAWREGRAAAAREAERACNSLSSLARRLAQGDEPVATVHAMRRLARAALRQAKGA